MNLKTVRNILSEVLGDDAIDMDDAMVTAQYAHRGQKRRSGEDYIAHPIEVANIVQKYYPGNKLLYKAALLHDSLEDAIDLGNVRDEEELFALIADSAESDKEAKDIIDIVMTLTKPKGADYARYVLSLANDPDSMKIKMADMFHNLQSSPSPKQIKKYQNALKEIEASFGGIPSGVSQSHFTDLKNLANSLGETNSRIGDLIKEATKEIILMEGKKVGAGIVVVRKFSEGWRVLGLLTDEGYDLPKGQLDKGESLLQGALRETYEEANISDCTFSWDYQSLPLQHLTMYVAQTNQDPAVLINPKSGIYEHQACHWLEWDQLIEGIYPYLVPAVQWARDIVEKL